MDDDLKKKKSDSLLKLALEEEMLQDENMLKYMSDDEIKTPHEFSEIHRKHMKKIFKMADKIEHKDAYRRRNLQIAAGVAVFLCLSTVTITQVEAFRLPILNFFMDIKSKSTRLEIQEENKLKLADEYSDYEPEYVPSGYVITLLEQDKGGFTVQFESEDGQYWYRYQYIDKMGNLNLDSETGDVSEENINSKPAVVIRKGEEIRIIVDIGKQRFCLNGNLSYEEAVKIMESVNY